MRPGSHRQITAHRGEAVPYFEAGCGQKPEHVTVLCHDFGSMGGRILFLNETQKCPSSFGRALRRPQVNKSRGRSVGQHDGVGAKLALVERAEDMEKRSRF